MEKGVFRVAKTAGEGESRTYAVTRTVLHRCMRFSYKAAVDLTSNSCRFTKIQTTKHIYITMHTILQLNINNTPLTYRTRYV